MLYQFTHEVTDNLSLLYHQCDSEGNYARLTVRQLKWLAVTLGFPTSASSDEIRQLIEAKVEEIGHEPRNVLVVVVGLDMELLDEEGVFLNIGPEEAIEDASYNDDAESGTEAEDIAALRRGLEDAGKEIQTLAIENEALKEMLGEAKVRVR